MLVFEKLSIEITEIRYLNTGDGVVGNTGTVRTLSNIQVCNLITNRSDE